MGAPAPAELIIWRLIFDTGWTMDYIQTLPMSVLREYLQIKDGTLKAYKK